MKLIKVTKEQQRAISQAWSNEARIQFEAEKKPVEAQKYTWLTDDIEIFIVSGRNVLTLEAV